MLQRKIKLFSLLAACLLLSLSLLPAQTATPRKPRKFTVPPLSSRIEVVVVRDANGKPIENAAVVFHPVEGDRDHGVMELKTNEEGKAVIDVIPLGDTVRLQVIARGFQTSGEEFKVDKEALHFEVRMKRPGGQYSIYKAPGQTTAKPQEPAAKPADTTPAPATPPTK